MYKHIMLFVLLIIVKRKSLQKERLKH